MLEARNEECSKAAVLNGPLPHQCFGSVRPQPPVSRTSLIRLLAAVRPPVKLPGSGLLWTAGIDGVTYSCRRPSPDVGQSMRRWLPIVLLTAAVATECASMPAVAADLVRVREAKLNGAEFAYVEEGPGTQVLFVHGALGDWRTWDGLRPYVSSRYPLACGRRNRILGPSPARAALGRRSSSGAHSPKASWRKLAGAEVRCR